MALNDREPDALLTISLDRLEPHPENPNFMNIESLMKLRRHIEQTGRYEPLVVRSHPRDPGTFQIINGNNRFRVLRALACEVADCLVWNVSDDQARLYLATLNRLCGQDVPERRAVLLEGLLGDSRSDELSRLLPEDRKQIEKLERVAGINVDDAPARRGEGRGAKIPIIVSLRLEECAARDLNLALDVIVRGKGERLSRGQALARLAKAYLQGLGTTASG